MSLHKRSREPETLSDFRSVAQCSGVPPQPTYRWYPPRRAAREVSSVLQRRLVYGAPDVDRGDVDLPGPRVLGVGFVPGARLPIPVGLIVDDVELSEPAPRVDT